MNSTLTRIRRDTAVLRARLVPPASPLSALEMAKCLGLHLDAWQQAAVQSTSPRLLLNVTRQGGKSTAAALMGLHEALSAPDRMVLVVSPGERQSKLLFRTVMKYYRALGRPVPATVESVLSLELANGSQIHALPGQEATVRGFSNVALLLVDEASRVPDELIGAIRPMLAVSGGRLVTMSTPWGKRGWWYAAWSEGGDDWQRFEVPATQCQRIPADFLDAERRALPAGVFASEYGCAFVDAEDAYFRSVDIENMADDTIVPLFPAGGGLL